MNIYPVVIPTLNRFDHLRRCIESLKANTHVEETELIIGLDYPPNEKYMEGYIKIKKYIPTISGFKKVTIIERKENYGAEKNYYDLRDYAFRNYDAIIFTEDDNEFSPCFLDFMNKALEKYKHDKRISSVQGYNDIHYYNLTDKNIIFVPSGGAWGFGIWRDKQYMLQSDLGYASEILGSLSSSWKIFRTFPAIFMMLISMCERNVIWGDVTYCCKNVLNGWYQVKPRISMVRNIGNDGSGIHCGVDDQYASQKIETASIFDLDDVEPSSDHQTHNSQFYSLLPDNRLKAWVVICMILLKYIKYRVHKSKQ